MAEIGLRWNGPIVTACIPIVVAGLETISMWRNRVGTPRSAIRRIGQGIRASRAV